MIAITPDDTPSGHDPGHSVLLVRRHRYTREMSFYRCHSTTPVALADLVSVVCTRWRIEEDFRAAKSLTGADGGRYRQPQRSRPRRPVLGRRCGSSRLVLVLAGADAHAEGTQVGDRAAHRPAAQVPRFRPLAGISSVHAPSRRSGDQGR